MIELLETDNITLADNDCSSMRSNSNDTRKLFVPRTHNKLGENFSAAGPRLWNDLPPGLSYGGRDLPSTPLESL